MSKNITINNIDVGYKRIKSDDFISLTDMAKFRNPDHTGLVIANWLRTNYTIEFMGIWEKTNNPDFNVVEFEYIRSESGSQSFTMSVTQWVERTKAIGIVSSAGRYGGTYAHKDIAFEFATWLSPEFKFWIVKEFQRLKEKEQATLEWTAKREFAKINYRIQTDAIKENLIVPRLTPKQISFVYANEADMLNVALFGKTAAEWREQNEDKKGNIRDYASIEQLLVLANLESYNAILIEQKVLQKERIVLLNKTAEKQLRTLTSVNIGYDRILALPKGDRKKGSDGGDNE